MNILYIDHYAGSLSLGMEFRPYYFAREWEKMGHKVLIVGANYSHLRKENPSVKKDFEIQNIDGVDFQWIKTREYAGNGVDRAITMLQFCGKLWLNARRVVKEFNPDVVITSSTYPLDVYPARRIKKLSSCKYIHEGHDLWPLTLTEIGGMNKLHPFVVLMAIGERHTYRKADKVVSVLPFSYKHMLKHGLKSKDNFTHIPNGIVLDDWNSPLELPDEHKRLFEKLKNENKFIVCYLGGHALSNKLDRLIDAANILQKEKDIAFVLVGKGVEKEHLIEKSENLKLDNVFFLPPVNKLQVPSVLSEADLLYIGAEYSSIYKYGVSLNKVYDYMMSSKPIAYGIDGAANNDVEEANAGVTFDSDDPDNICDVILNLKRSNADYLQQLGSNGKKWVLSNCEYSKLASRFLEIFES